MNTNVFTHETYLKKIEHNFKYFHRKSNIKGTDFQKSAANTIREQGFVVLENFLSPEILSSLQNKTENILRSGGFRFPTLAQSKIDPLVHKDLIDNYLFGTRQDWLKRGVAFEKKDFKSYDQVLTEFKPSTLEFSLPSKDAEFFNLWLHPDILGIAENYLGYKPFLMEAYIRRNFPSPYRTMNHFWHRDLNDKFHLIKGFVFLNDCELDNGPHEYVIGSHRDFKLNGKDYFDDIEVDSLYQQNQIAKSKVKAGTIVLEDTRGIHRAALPVRGYRDLGFAVFKPFPWYRKYNIKHFEIDRSIYNQLSEYQKQFVLPVNLN